MKNKRDITDCTNIKDKDSAERRLSGDKIAENTHTINQNRSVLFKATVGVKGKQMQKNSARCIFRGNPVITLLLKAAP